MKIELPTKYASLAPHEKRLVRERYIQMQGGNCWYCEEPLSEKSPHEVAQKPINRWRYPKGFFNHPIHLHHDHSDGLTIGAVHSYCNAVSFDYDESPLN